jgi:hypothetical protein
LAGEYTGESNQGKVKRAGASQRSPISGLPEKKRPVIPPIGLIFDRDDQGICFF